MKTLVATVFSACLTLVAGGASSGATGTRGTFDLVNSSLLESEYGRNTLSYLIECALPSGALAEAEFEAVTYSFDGAIGLAPNWESAPITSAEQEAVSACMFARVNAFGVPVQISMRTKSPSLEAVEKLMASVDEMASHTVFEGRFWGNIFLAEPVAYTCQGEASVYQTDYLRENNRICTLPLPEKDPLGRSISACGFVVTGICDDRGSIAVEEVQFDYVIDTYLR